MINTVPAISVFFKPRMSGTRYLKVLADRAVVTWSLTEPVGGVQDMTWTPTVNRFQAVLRKDGSIDLSYDEVHAEDAIVGVYPLVVQGAEKEIATIAAEENAAVPAHLDIKSVKLSSVDGLFLRATIETRGAVLPDNDPGIAGISYRICLDRTKLADGCAPGGSAGTIWTIQGGRGGGARGGGAPPRYSASGTGALPAVTDRRAHDLDARHAARGLQVGRSDLRVRDSSDAGHAARNGRSSRAAVRNPERRDEPRGRTSRR